MKLTSKDALRVAKLLLKELDRESGVSVVIDANIAGMDGLEYIERLLSETLQDSLRSL